MRITDTSDLWWKNAVIYCLDVETFMDWNGDGQGDFDGLAHRLDYLAELGVTCLWLMPFYPTPDKDDGYDVTDFYGVDRRFGSLGDVVEVIRSARDRGMRVIADLVVNHTSEKHPWFMSARSSRTSPYRDYYVWRDEIPEDPRETIFPGQEDGVWTLDEKTGQYYLHRFFHHQPDLNVANPRVREEIGKIIGFWLELGLSGFRVDAVPFFIEHDGGASADYDDPHVYLRELSEMTKRRRGDSILLGEVNLPYKEQVQFFGGDDGDELAMQFDFEAMQRCYLSFARGDARPLASTLAKRPALARRSQWANFLRNHDELTLDKLSDSEREEVFAAFGPEERMRAFGRGITRRLPPMLEGDPRRIRMAYSLLFSMPGTPVLFYGEELGMGENLEAEGRHAVRTPMQWNSGKNGGFSTARRRALPGPVTEGPYGPEFVNADQQVRDPDSLHNFIRLLTSRYRSSPEIGWGELTILKQPHDAVLAHRMTGPLGSMIALHNFSGESLSVAIDVEGGDEDTNLVDLLHDGSTEVSAEGTAELALGPYGYRWLRVTDPGSRRIG
ncbi:alpha-amylase family protein [Salinibacterium sp. SYSU T00001]|uniref:alpha-amylase family protein n=1 Tax=Homoserinimonas sedimenticola TaxID=2986805 RepID=UPI0022369772|nr:alpha-amylase family protein [Salinibacterium sedimenticola]MCW4384872.1 alpha-amylase family protein [Salinibacterium sedimenticola]